MYPSGNENQSTIEVNFYQATQNHTTKQKVILSSCLGCQQAQCEHAVLNPKLLGTLWIGKLVCKLILDMWNLGAPSPDEKSLVEQQGLCSFWKGVFRRQADNALNNLL